MKTIAVRSFFCGPSWIMQRGFLLGTAGRNKPPAASTGSTGTGPAAAGSTSVGPAASTGSSGGTGPAGVAGSASAGPAASTGSGAGGFGPYSQEQVEQFVKQLKHMDMLGIDTYVTCSGEIFDREELRQVIKRFDR